VTVRDEDVVDVDEADAGAQELALRALAAVDEDAVAAAPDEMSGRAAMGARRRAGGAEEEHAQVHRPIVWAEPSGSGDARRDVADLREVSLGQNGPGPAKEDVELQELALVAGGDEPEHRRRRSIVIGRAALVEVHDAGVGRREGAQMPDGAHGRISS
jgi:hypothetical protein